MGSRADVFCHACGYETVVTIGGGMENYQVFSGWPVCCDNCGSVTTTNLREQPMKCLSCGSDKVTPYGEVKVRSERKQRALSPMFQWGERVYFEESHVCPRCSKNSLRFDTSNSIFFD